MTAEQKKLLRDIELAVLNIDIHLQGKRDFIEFTKSITQRRAVERELEIIGEAVNKLLRFDSSFPISSARKIVNLRDRVIQPYDAVDETIVWKVIIRDIPILLEEVLTLMKQY